jgi:hypothetical protein
MDENVNAENVNISLIAGGDSTSGSITNINNWGFPSRIEVREVGETIEMLYKETSMITLTIHPSPPPEERVFKIVYSCVDGKWNKSDRIYGKIVPAQNENYEFDI